jgi:hypothetical protein
MLNRSFPNMSMVMKLQGQTIYDDYVQRPNSWTKVLRVFLGIHSHLYLRILLPPHLSESGLKLVCNVNNVYRNRQSKDSQDHVQKPQRNCTFMNSATVLTCRSSCYLFELTVFPIFARRSFFTLTVLSCAIQDRGHKSIEYKSAFRQGMAMPQNN